MMEMLFMSMQSLHEYAIEVNCLSGCDVINLWGLVSQSGIDKYPRSSLLSTQL